MDQPSSDDVAILDPVSNERLFHAAEEAQALAARALERPVVALLVVGDGSRVQFAVSPYLLPEIVTELAGVLRQIADRLEAGAYSEQTPPARGEG